MAKYNLDIARDKNPFINIEVDEAGSVIIGSYECGKIERKLFRIYKPDLEILIKALEAVNKLIV